MIKAAKLPRIRFHDLRHTTATSLLEQGENPKAVSELPQFGGVHDGRVWARATGPPGADDGAAPGAALRAKDASVARKPSSTRGAAPMCPPLCSHPIG